MQRKAREDAKALHINITGDYDNLKQEVVRHGPYSNAEDDVVTNGMRDRKHWKEQMSNMFRDLNNLVALINIHNIAHTDVDIDTLGAKVNNLRQQLPEIITSIEDEDRERGLFYDRPTKLCPMQIPSYSGTPSEDFIIFRDRFREAAKD